MTDEDDSISITDQAVLKLRELLTSDQVRPGDRLGEVAVAKRLGISRTPVRAALQRLEQEQLVARHPNGGYTVAGLSMRDVREACDLLRIVDAELFIRAAEALDEAAASELRDCTARMKTAAAAGDIETWSHADTRFHEILGGAADHRLFIALAIQQRRRLHRFWRAAALRFDRLANCATEHEQIANSVSASDEEEIRRLVNEHIDHMEASLLRTLEMVRPFVPTAQMEPDERTGR